MRLTNEMRDEALNTVWWEKLEPRVAAIREKLKTIARAVADRRYPDDVKAWMKQGPVGAFHAKGTFKLLLNDDVTVKHRLLQRGSGPPDYSVNYHTGARIEIPTIKVLAADEHLYELKLNGRESYHVRRMLKTLDKLDTEWVAVKRTVAAALAACNSLKQVEEHYPDLLKYLPKTRAPAVTKALAITNNDVKEALRVLSA